MDVILPFLKEIGWGALGGAVFTFAIWFLPFGLRESFKTSLQRTLQRDVESHKNALDQLTERLKHDLQKEMISAEVVIAEKHKIYSELYKLLLIADGNVAALHGARNVLTFEEYGADDFEKHIKARKVPLAKAQELVDEFKRDRENAITQWRSYEMVLEMGEARSAIYEAGNYWLEKELYMSDKVSAQAQELKKNLSDRLVNIEMPDIDNLRADRIQNRELDRKIKENLNLLKISMKAELQRGMHV